MLVFIITNSWVINMYSRPPLTQSHKAQLLKLARSTVQTYLETGKVPKLKTQNQRMCSTEGAFVTLTHQNQLRGCMGRIKGSMPLYETIKQMAISAATEDSRFPPVLPAELNELTFEISVLSSLKEIQSADEITLGMHGVLIKGLETEAVFLPKIALERQWSRTDLLNELCAKAHMPANNWSVDPTCQLYTFTADVFSES